MGLLEQFKQGLSRTRAVLATDVGDLVRGLAKLDAATLDSLEDTLVAADFGPAAAAEILVAVRRDLSGGSDPSLIRRTVKEKVRAILERGHTTMRGILDETTRDIRAVLRPDQQTKFDRMRPRSPFPHGGGHGGAHGGPPAEPPQE